MEQTIYKPSIYKGTGIYKGAGGIYKGRGVYNDGTAIFAEIGGRKYPVVKIDNLLWLAENLDYKFDGCTIGGNYITSNPNAWYYNNNENDYGIDGVYKCGLLYNWYAVKYLEQNKINLLPDGWRVPSITDFNNFSNFVSSSTGAPKIKALDNSIITGFPSGWNGNNELKFNALPVGWRSTEGTGIFKQFGAHAHFWLKDENGVNGYSWYLNPDANTINSSIYNPKGNGFALRLCKDA